MYLDKVKAKGNFYVFLREWDTSVTYSKDKRTTLYNFGRLEKALLNMYRWRENFNSFPEELKKIGCVRSDLDSWIESLEAKSKLKPSPPNTMLYSNIYSRQ